MVIINFFTSFTWLRANKSGPTVIGIPYGLSRSGVVCRQTVTNSRRRVFLFGKMAHVTKKSLPIEKQKGTPCIVWGEQKDTRAGSFWHTGTCLLSCISTV